MNATTVNQFATRANGLAYAIETLGGKTDRLRKRKAAPEKTRTDLMSDEDYAEMLQRMDPFEAARIQREE